MDSHLAKGRVVDTFAAKGLRVPDSLKETDSLGKYSLQDGRGLELKNRRPDKKRKVVI